MMRDPEPSALVRDTIPRVQHLPYLQVLLDGIASGRTFDQLRADLRAAAATLSRRAGGQVAASRVSDAYAAWSVVADSLGELIRLGLLERRPVPSKRDSVDLHRNARYELTEEGQRLQAATHANPSAFRRAIAPVLIQRHPYLDAVLKRLESGPLVLPEYTEAELQEMKNPDGQWISRLGADAARRITAETPDASTSPERIVERLRQGLQRRFRNAAPQRPKAVLDAVQDILVSATLEAFGLKIDAITFNLLASWGAYLYLLAESRYVADRSGRVLWATADVSRDESEVQVAWRGLAAYGDQVTKELARAYRELANMRSGGAAGGFPYIPIYEVRALAAFRVGVSDELVDRVIAGLVDGERAAPMRVDLALGQASWQATSERPFHLGDRRYYVMIVKPEENGA